VKTVAVTGASGLVGTHFCRFFALRGWNVRALVRDPEDALSLGSRSDSIPRFRCRLPGEVDPAGLAGANVLVHCAYATRGQDLADAQRINIAGTHELIELGRELRIERIVFISSLSASATSRSYYGRSKHAIEQTLAPLADLILRPGLVLSAEGSGLFQRLRDTIARSRFIPVFTGEEAILQTVHVDDLCAALERAIELELTGALNVAEDEGWPFVRFLGEVAARLGKSCVPVRLPATPALWTLRALEALHLSAPVTSENLLGLLGMRRVSTAADLQRLGLQVRTAAESLDAILGRRSFQR